MTLKKLEKYLLSKNEAFCDYPFGPEAAVYKVAGKMFALVAIMENPLHITLKCDPEDAYILRAKYEAVKPGYHMNHEHWNTVVLDGSITDVDVFRMIDESYVLVVKGLKKADRGRLLGE